MNTLKAVVSNGIAVAASAQVYHGAAIHAATAATCTVTDTAYGTVLDVFSVPTGQTRRHVFPRGVQAPGGVTLTPNSGAAVLVLYTAPL